MRRRDGIARCCDAGTPAPGSAGTMIAFFTHKVMLASIDGDATVVECAAVMAWLRSPLLAVVDRGHVHGLLTAAHLLEMLLDRPAAQASVK